MLPWVREQKKQNNIRNIILASAGLLGTAGISYLLYNSLKDKMNFSNTTQRIKKTMQKKPYIRDSSIIYLADDEM